MSNEAKPSNKGKISEMVQGWSDGLQQDKPGKRISQKEKMLLDVAAFLDELIIKMEEGETDTAKEMLKRQIQEYDEQRKKSAAKQTKAHSPARENLQNLWSISILGSDETIEVAPLKTEEDLDNYLKVKKENDTLKGLWDDRYIQLLKDEVMSHSCFYCAIFLADCNEFIGYCGVNNINDAEWDLAIELTKEYQNKGYGYRAMRCLMDGLRAETGERHFKVRVDPDNIASQSLMRKLGFKPAGITTFLIKEERDLAQLEEANSQCMDERLMQLAEEFGVEPRKLLSHVLVYEIEL